MHPDVLVGEQGAPESGVADTVVPKALQRELLVELSDFLLGGYRHHGLYLSGPGLHLRGDFIQWGAVPSGLAEADPFPSPFDASDKKEASVSSCCDMHTPKAFHFYIEFIAFKIDHPQRH
jgi:hypothetical protein